jgi:phosphoribosylglycinamide formyltransferase-1
MRLGVLASGRGSNLQALLDAQAAGQLGEARIICVIANVPDAPALARARSHGVLAEFHDHHGHSREAYDEILLSRLSAHRVEMLCLAGYMRRLSAMFIRRFPGVILNIHPSLLPAFPGLHAQEQALDYGVAITGATVHIVDDGLDTGPIIAQAPVEVLPDDDTRSLSARILTVEHQLYPAAVVAMASGRYRRAGRRIILTSYR